MQDIYLIINWLFVFINIIIFWICAILFLIKSKRSELNSQKIFFIGVSAFFIFWGFMRLVFEFSNYYIEIDLNLYSTLWKVASSLGIAAILSIIIVMETYMVKSKYVFSIITLLGLILCIILPIYGHEISGARLAAYIFLPAGGLSIIALYLYLYIKLSGRARHTTGFIAAGLTLIFLGYLLNIELIKQLITIDIMGIITSIIMICGGLLYTILYYKKSE